MRTVEFLFGKMPTYYLHKLEKTMARNRVSRSDSTILRKIKQKKCSLLTNTHTQFELHMRSSLFNRGVEQMRQFFLIMLFIRDIQLFL